MQRNAACAANKVGIFSGIVFLKGFRDRKELTPFHNIAPGGKF